MDLLELVEVPKRSSDHLLALIKLIQDPQKAQDFLNRIEAGLQEQRDLQLQGVKVRDLKRLQATAEKKLAEGEKAEERANQVIAKAHEQAQGIVFKAEELKAAAQKKYDTAKQLETDAQALRDEAAAANDKAVEAERKAFEAQRKAQGKLADAEAKRNEYQERLKKLEALAKGAG